MVNLLFWKKKKREAPKIKPKRDDHGSGRVLTKKIAVAPEPQVLVARAAYSELKLFQLLSGPVGQLSDLHHAELVSAAAGEVLVRHHKLVAALEKGKADPLELQREHRESIDALFVSTRSSNWYEQLLSAHILGGFLRDTFRSLAEEKTTALNEALLEILDSADGSVQIVIVLEHFLQQGGDSADRLALWGRRLAGDAILATLGSMKTDSTSPHFDMAAEIVLGDIVANHTRRMDALGLTA